MGGTASVKPSRVVLVRPTVRQASATSCSSQHDPGRVPPVLHLPGHGHGVSTTTCVAENAPTTVVPPSYPRLRTTNPTSTQ